MPKQKVVQRADCGCGYSTIFPSVPIVYCRRHKPKRKARTDG